MKTKCIANIKTAIRSNFSDRPYCLAVNEDFAVRLTEACFIPFNIEVQIGLAILETITTRKENELHLQN